LARNILLNQNSYGGNRGGSLISAILGAAPTLPTHNEDGTINNIMISYPFMGNNIRNPFYYIDETSDELIENKEVISAAFLIEPIKGLSIKIAGNVYNNDSREDGYSTLKNLGSSGSASVATKQDFSYLSENTINYTKTINDKHNLSALVGYTYEEGIHKRLSGSGVGFLSDVTYTGNLQGATTPGIPTSSYFKSTLIS